MRKKDLKIRKSKRKVKLRKKPNNPNNPNNLYVEEEVNRRHKNQADQIKSDSNLINDILIV
jgi:hypothetical protein